MFQKPIFAAKILEPIRNMSQLPSKKQHYVGDFHLQHEGQKEFASYIIIKTKYDSQKPEECNCESSQSVMSIERCRTALGNYI